MDEEEKSWCLLVELQEQLRKSKESNSEYEKEILDLKKRKEETSQRLIDLHLTSQDSIATLLEDRDIVSKTREREEALAKQKMLIDDLNSVTSLVGKLKLEITRCNHSIQVLENDSNEVKASIMTASEKRKKVVKEIETTRTMAEKQKLIVTQLTDDIRQEQIIGDRLKKRLAVLKTNQRELLHRKLAQEQQIAKLQEAIKVTRSKARETNQVIKARLRQLRARSIQVDQLNVRLSHTNNIFKRKTKIVTKTTTPHK